MINRLKCSTEDGPKLYVFKSMYLKFLLLCVELSAAVYLFYLDYFLTAVVLLLLVVPCIFFAGVLFSLELVRVDINRISGSVQGEKNKRQKIVKWVTEIVYSYETGKVLWGEKYSFKRLRAEGESFVWDSRYYTVVKVFRIDGIYGGVLIEYVVKEGRPEITEFDKVGKSSWN